LRSGNHRGEQRTDDDKHHRGNAQSPHYAAIDAAPEKGNFGQIAEHVEHGSDAQYDVKIKKQGRHRHKQNGRPKARHSANDLSHQGQ